ncbi:MAG TPA: FGGY family carbohydrate kinase [Solirubrobacteraceae bacterium]|nr:FGGY family carbohydrate kinase [Solirubrobacteraceae bacterium]
MTAAGREPLLVGVDVGTSRTKAGIVDAAGHECACASVPTHWRRSPHGGETSGAAISAGVREALAAALARCPEGEIVALGVTSIAETVIVLDGAGEELAPAIAWYDTRAAADHRALVDALSPAARTGLSDDAIPSLATLHWLTSRSPRTMRRARHALSVAEWVVRDLGGVIASEPSLASRTAALGVAERAWWPEAVAWAGVHPDVFGELREAGASWGEVRSAPGLGRLAGATLTVAGHDHLVAAVGSGLTRTGQVMDSCGTAEALLRPIPADPGLDLAAVVARGVNCGWHVLPGVYNLIVGLRLGLELAPLLERLGSRSDGGRTPLDDEALAWLTTGSGEEHRAGEKHAAVEEAAAWATALQGAVDASRRALEDLREIGGPIERVLIGGGWAANPVLRALKQTAFPHPVYPQVDEPGVRGAALLAGRAAGVFASPADFPAPPLHHVTDAQEIAVP